MFYLNCEFNDIQLGIHSIVKINLNLIG